MKIALSLALFTTACATTHTAMDREPAQRSKVQLELAPSADERAVFPAIQSPRVPSVDRLAYQLRGELGEGFAAALELCVAPDGNVTKVALTDGTTFEALDAAILRDAKQWRFASLPGSTAATRLQTCERATLQYLAPR
ncbi:MAG TPA: hypothetical protein VK427_18590 [Kofleriaceae bacterium]|nr:hypothetical protein [Kofleriaceae bacterium]